MLAIAIALGLDVGQVVQQGVAHDDSARVDTTGAGWVRINFRLDDYPSLDEAWFDAYDAVVDAYLARGIQVYGLINDEAVATSAPFASDDWIAAYRDTSLAIVDHFKNRVRVFELINEPNDYAGGDSARFPADRFAKAVQDTYTAIKRDHADDRCWQVDLVSGPLFSFDGNSSADYLQATVDAWGGDLPLDGIGYHLYVAQGPDSASSDVGPSMDANLDAVRAVIPDLPFYVSEYGWRADLVGDGEQAARMQAGADAMAARGDVALAVYFTQQDFPDNAWGVFDSAGERRSSADQLAQLAAANLPAYNARVAQVATPLLTANAIGDVVVTLENRGAQTWPAGDAVRLGAAAGCPDATDENAIAWVPDAGYANSPTDARVFLAADVPPGGSIDVHVPVQAPASGTYHFAARMVVEGVAWFGATASADIVVGDPDIGPTIAGSNDAGCSSGGATGLGAGLALIGLSRRKRKHNK